MIGSTKYAYVFTALFSVVNTYGQSGMQDSLHTILDERAINYFVLTGNAATLASTKFPQFGFASLATNSVNGNFKRPMDFAASNNITVGTGGFKNLNGWGYLTSFTYCKQFDQEIAWSGVAHPYEGNPFLWADSSSGNWERDHINAAISVAAPVIFKRLQTGVTLNYRIGTGARITEPKPFYRMRYLALQPGANWLLSKKSSVGFTSKIDFIQEENELGFFSEDNVLLYRLRGYGTFSRSPFVNGERKRQGIDLQTSAHYQLALEKFRLLVNAFYVQRGEEINEGIAIQQQSGTFNEFRLGASAMIQYGNAEKGKSVLATFTQRDGFADDATFNAQSASFRFWLVRTDFSTWTTTGISNALWQFTLSPEVNVIDKIDQATRTQLTATTLGLSLKANWRKKIKKQVYLQLQPIITYNHFADGVFTNQTSNTIIENLIRPEYQFYAANNIHSGFLATLELHPTKANIGHSLSVKGATTSAISSVLFQSRNNYHLIYTILI